MNVLSLFSGIGGIDLGLERAGMTVVGQVELDPFCRRVLQHHWPEVPLHDDVRTAVQWWMGERRPPVHLVAGGPPCQPFSQAGWKLGEDDPRYRWPSMAEVIEAVRPQWVLFENVPGLLRRGFGAVLGDLDAIGYDAEWDCIPAASVGAPHRRDRVFVVAYARGTVGGWAGGPVGADGGGAVGGGAAEPRRRRGVVADAESDGRGTRRTGRSVNDAAAGEGDAPQGLADAPGVGRDSGAVHGGVGAERGWAEPVGGDPSGGGVPDADGAGLEGHRVFRSTPYRDQWPTEPAVRRVANGVPSQMDRLRSLGNAVVPAVAEHVGRLIMACASTVDDDEPDFDARERALDDVLNADEREGIRR